MSRYHFGVVVGVVIHCLIFAACVIWAPVWVPVAWGLYWLAIWAEIIRIEVSRVAGGWAVGAGVTGSKCGCKRVQFVVWCIQVSWVFGRCRNARQESGKAEK